MLKYVAVNIGSDHTSAHSFSVSTTNMFSKIARIMYRMFQEEFIIPGEKVL
jgi:hypothetical protein